MYKPLSVAVDGPAGSGKSTLAKKLAEHYQLSYVDTGAMYRAVALKVFDLGVDYFDEQAIGEILADTSILFAQNRILLDGKDVSHLIRTPEAGKGASAVSTLPTVRKFLFGVQRELADAGNVIMDGRDIGTVIMPNATVKIFLIATPEERARRRQLEFQQKGIDQPFEEILRDVKARDKQDSERAAAPLKQAEDAILVDSSHMTIEEVTAHCIAIIDEKRKNG